MVSLCAKHSRFSIITSHLCWISILLWHTLGPVSLRTQSKIRPILLRCKHRWTPFPKSRGRQSLQQITYRLMPVALHCKSHQKPQIIFTTLYLVRYADTPGRIALYVPVYSFINLFIRVIRDLSLSTTQSDLLLLGALIMRDRY